MIKKHHLIYILFNFIFIVTAFAHQKDSTKMQWRNLDTCAIKIKIPLNYDKGLGFEGFTHKESGTSIVFHQYKNYSYKLYHAGFVGKSNYHNNADTQLTGIDTLKIGKHKGYMYNFNFSPREAQIAFKRKLFITGDMNRTLLIMINYPEALEEEINEQFFKSLKTLRLK